MAAGQRFVKPSARAPSFVTHRRGTFATTVSRSHARRIVKFYRASQILPACLSYNEHPTLSSSGNPSLKVVRHGGQKLQSLFRRTPAPLHLLGTGHSRGGSLGPFLVGTPL